MSNIKIYLAVVMIASLLVSACKKNDESPTVTQTFDLKELSGIKLSIAADVKIIEGPVQNITVTGPENTVNEITTTVVLGIWNIGLPNSYIENYNDLDITITSSLLESLTVSGSGEIIATDTLPLSYLSISGSGDIDAITNTTILRSNISGSGEIKVSGIADILKYDLSGSGDFEGFGLEINDAEINMSGSGNTEISVYNSLDVKISGSGDLYYKGAPSITQNITGSGKVINAN